VQPHRTRSFKLSTDPFFVEKVRDIVGLYLNPSDHPIWYLFFRPNALVFEPLWISALFVGSLL